MFLKVFDRRLLDVLLHHFSNTFFGSWSVFPQLIPRRGPGSNDGVVHAALLHTGKVLFITADETTMLWNRMIQPPLLLKTRLTSPTRHLMLWKATRCSAADIPFCRMGGCWLLVVVDTDPTIKRSGAINLTRQARHGQEPPVAWHNRWYPTVLTLGDQRIANSHEILVVCGHGSGDMEIYDEASDSFTEVTSGDDKPFPSLYPGLHLLPNHSIFYSRTGWASAGPGGGPFAGDDQSGYFVFTGVEYGRLEQYCTRFALHAGPDKRHVCHVAEQHLPLRSYPGDGRRRCFY